MGDTARGRTDTHGEEGVVTPCRCLRAESPAEYDIRRADDVAFRQFLSHTSIY